MSRDPLPELLAEWRSSVDAYNACSKPEEDAASERMNAAQAALCKATATTPAGLLAQAEFIREEVGETIRNEWCSEISVVIDRFCDGVTALLAHGHSE